MLPSQCPPRVSLRAFEGILCGGERCLVVQRRVMLVIVQPLNTQGPALSPHETLLSAAQPEDVTCLAKGTMYTQQ